MKIKALLLVASALLLASCGEQETQEKEAAQEEKPLAFSINEPQKIEGVVEYDIINVSASEQIKPPNPASVTTVMEVENSDSRFLDMTVKVKNLNSADKTAPELIDVTYTIGGQEYAAFQKNEHNNASMLRDGEFTSIAPLSNAVVHYIAEVPKFEPAEEVQIKAEIGGKTYLSEFTLEDFNGTKEFISIGDTLELPQYANLSLENMYYTERVEPPNPGSVSRYYEPEAQTNTFLVLEMKVKNLKSAGLQADSVFAAKVIYDQYYEFDGFPELISADGSNLEPANITSIPSLNENTILYILELPKELKDSEGVVSIWFNNDYYHVEVNNQVSSKQARVPEEAKSSSASGNNGEISSSDGSAPPERGGERQSAPQSDIKKGHTQMTTEETLALISHNEGIDFSTHSYEMTFDENDYLIIDVGLGQMAVGTYKIDGDGTLLQLDVANGVYLPAEQVADGGS